VFSSHVDVGFAVANSTGFAIDVINAYFTVFFPAAVTISKQIHTLPGIYFLASSSISLPGKNYTYTAQPWLVSLYLDCAQLKHFPVKLKCPNATELADFEQAVRNVCLMVLSLNVTVRVR
jgi:hypothetical protein